MNTLLRRAALAAAVLALCSVAAVAAAPEGGEKPGCFPVDDEARAILEKMEALGPYRVPDLEIKKDSRYAGTPSELEPFGAVPPFKRHFLEQMVYTGPGRSLPEPEDVESVKIGFIGPIMSTVSVATGGLSHEEPLGIQMLRGSRMAIEEANACGGYTKRGIPFELYVRNDNGLWGASGNEIVDMAYKEHVWAILGTIDGANSHIAIRVALKAEVFMINTGDTDPTFIETNIPWLGRVIGDDRQMGYLMVDYLYRKLGLERVGIMRASNRYGRFGVREIRDGSRRLGRPIVQEMAYKLGLDDFTLHLDRLEKAGVQAIVHWGDAREGALILNQMRARGMKQPFFASDRAVSDEFVEIAGANAEGVMAGYPWNPERHDPRLESFKKRFRERFGTEPDTYAAHAYDGMNMVIWAVQAAGLNRAKIRDLIAYRTTPWPGVTGEIPLSAVLDDVGEVYLARYHEGAWHYLSREDLEIPMDPLPGAGKAEASLESAGAGDPEPHFDAREQVSGYAGPGREAPEPDDAVDVPLAWFGPHGDDPVPANDPWQAARLAVERANASGGYGGRPFRLVPIWSEDPWGTGIARLAKSAYRDGIWAVIGGSDGPSAHLAEQVVAKARLPLVNASSTDETVNLANVPWTFTFMPTDTLQAEALAEEIRGHGDAARSLVVSATDHDSRRLAAELLAALTRQGPSPRHHLEFDGGEEGAVAVAEEVASLAPPSVVILAGPEASAVFLRALRSELDGVRTYGSAVMGSRAFREAACPSSDGTIFPRLCDPASVSPEFVQAFREAVGASPDCSSAQAWDAATMLVEAIRRAGLNRARIRDALASLAGEPAGTGEAHAEASGLWSGEAGPVLWDGLGQNQRPVTLAVLGEPAPAAGDPDAPPARSAMP